MHRFIFFQFASGFLPSFIVLERYCMFINILWFKLTEGNIYFLFFYWMLSDNWSVGEKKCGSLSVLGFLHHRMDVDVSELIIIMIL